MFLFSTCCGETGAVTDVQGTFAEEAQRKKSMGFADVSAEDYHADTAAEDQHCQDIKIKDFELKIHSAELSRSFAKVGWMDPYAVITADGKEASRTKPASHAHKTPKWETSHHFQSGGLPQVLMIAVWDKNNFHKDVLCGAVTIPCSPDMGSMEMVDWTLTKKGAPTGTIRVSLKAVEEGTDAVPRISVSRRGLARKKTLGGELDQLVAFAEGTATDVQVTMQEHQDHPNSSEEHEDHEHGLKMVAVKTIPGGQASPLMGSWKCVDTHGLEDFLKAAGVGMFQRKLAMGASWPSWDFSNEGTHIAFVNHSAIGDLKENFVLGKEYQWKDGHSNEFTCLAEWTKADDGGSLKVTRKGKIGEYIEERTVKGDTLEFVLTHITYKVTWGRKFERHLV